MSRSINGALVAASAILAAGLLSGCGAGRQTQTSAQVPPISGVNADVIIDPDAGVNAGRITLRDLAIAFQSVQGYPRGGTAPLIVHITNETTSAVTLTSVTLTQGGGTVVLTGGPAGSLVPSGVGAPGAPPSGTGIATGAAATPSKTGGPAAPSEAAGAAGASVAAPSEAAPSGAAGASAPASGAATSAAPSTGAGPAGSPTPGGSGAPGPTPGTGATAGATALNVTIPADGYIDLTPDNGRYLAATGLPQPLRLNDSLQLTFTFTVGNGKPASTTLSVPFTMPLSPLPRSPLDLPSENGGGEGNQGGAGGNGAQGNGGGEGSGNGG